MKYALVMIAAVAVLLAAEHPAVAAGLIETPALSSNPSVGNGVVCFVNNLSTAEKKVLVDIVVGTGEVECSALLSIAPGGVEAVPCNPTNFYSYCRAKPQGSANQLRVNHCVKDGNFTTQACAR